jgi:serine/threonine protein kinase
MPAPATVPEFLDLVRKSGLAPANKLDELLSRHRATGTPQTVDQTAGLLVRDGQLTFFQSKQLKLGRYKRFTIGSKYRLLELIGAGGMGAVYLCEHTLMKRLVALKVLPVEKLDDPSNLDRFHREARAVAALDHPNIVRAYDIDQYDKLHFLVMEYVDGTSLQEIVARYAMEKKQFDPIRAAHYIAQAAVGMQHGHELGMVHRDIKPGNLLLDRTGVIKVLDMGLARFFNKQQDSVTEKYDDKCVLGTADYLAPEQARTNVVDVRADVYSLGGTLYFMLTGRTPFPDGTIAAKLVAHQTREPQPVESLRADVPAGVLAVLQKMMAKEPGDRYQQPIEVAEALAEWADQPIAPPPEREMPTLCPLVQSLIGAPLSSSGSQPSLARVLFAPGRGVFARGDGSSAGSRGRAPAPGADSKSTASNAAFPVSAKSVPRYAPDGNVPVGGPISTARANTSPTAPIPLRPVPGSGAKPKLAPRAKAPPAELERSPARAHAAGAFGRVWMFVAIGVAAAVLFVGAAVVAYQVGKGNKPGAGTHPPTNPDAPKSAEVILTPARAAEHEGEEQTVEFKVRSVTGTADLELNSEPEAGSPDNFSVRVAARHFGSPGERDKVRQEFEGRTIRARGKIARDARGGWHIDVNSAKQIATVGR